MEIKKLNSREKLNSQGKKETKALTRIDFFLGISAIIILFVIGIRHWDTWGKTNIMEGFFALMGLVSLDFIKNDDFGRGKPYKPLRGITLVRGLALFIIVVLVQVLASSLIPFTIDNIELAMSIMFASVAEELFFRGFLISVFKRIGDLTQRQSKYAIFDFVGMVLSSVFFAYIHTNYYNNPSMLIALFIGGMVFSIFYYKFDDLSANILAHFILNTFVVYQSGLLVNL